jgi:hypothetical protein
MIGLIRGFIGCLLLGLTFFPVPAHGQSAPPEPTAAEAPFGTPEYQTAIKDGLTAFRSGDFATARSLFERAHSLMPNARTWRALGLTAIEQKRYTLGRRELETALQDSRQALTDGQRREISEMLAWMRSALATITIETEPADAQVTLDDEPVSGSATVEPGSHRLHVDASGYVPVEQALQATAGLEQTVHLVLGRRALDPQAAANVAATSSGPFDVQPQPARGTEEPSSAATPVTQRWWFWTAVGAAVVSGTVLAIALSTSSESAELPGKRVEVLRGP